MSERPALFVEAVIDGRVVVSARGRDGRRTARRLGCRRTGRGRYSKATHSDEALAQVLASMRDAGLPFVGGSSGWPPTAVAEELRGRGLLQGTWTEVRWTGPGDVVLFEGR
jgi:hypothetical protein